MSAIDSDYLAVCARIDMIHTRNETLTIWLRRKVYCKFLCAFLHPLQHVEGHDVEKTSATFHLLTTHRINNSAAKHLPEVDVVTAV